MMARKDGQFERTIEHAERDAQAARLRSQGLTYVQISEAMGLGGRNRAHEMVKRAIASAPREAAQELIAIETERLDDRDRRLHAILVTFHPLVSHGRLIKDEKGQPIEDVMPKLAALRELRANGESRRRLLGLDAPTRNEVTVVTRDAVEQAIAELEAKLAENDPAAVTAG